MKRCQRCQRCQRCGRRVAKVRGYSIGRGLFSGDYWVHASRFGAVKQFVRHAPEVCDG